MPQRQAVPTITVRTPEAMGEDSFVIFRRSSDLTADRDTILDELEAQDVVFDASGKPSGGEFTPTQLDAMGMIQLSECLVDWNWVDSEGAPLPKPKPDDPKWTVRMLRSTLRRDEIEYLSAKLVDVLDRPGNSRRSKRS